MAGRKVHTSQRGIIRADPSAERDLNAKHDQTERSAPPDFSQDRRWAARQSQMACAEPSQQGHQRHAAQQVQRNDCRLEQKSHGPFSEQSLQCNDHNKQQRKANLYGGITRVGKSLAAHDQCLDRNGQNHDAHQ